MDFKPTALRDTHSISLPKFNAHITKRKTRTNFILICTERKAIEKKMLWVMCIWNRKRRLCTLVGYGDIFQPKVRAWYNECWITKFSIPLAFQSNSTLNVHIILTIKQKLQTELPKKRWKIFFYCRVCQSKNTSELWRKSFFFSPFLVFIADATPSDRMVILNHLCLAVTKINNITEWVAKAILLFCF